MTRRLKLIEYDANIFAGDAMDPAIQFRDQLGAVSGSVPAAQTEQSGTVAARIAQQIDDMFTYAGRLIEPELKDYYNTGASGYIPFTNDQYGEDIPAQVFTSTSAYTLSKVKVRLQAGGSVNETITLSIRAVSAGVPTGADLAASSPIVISSMPAGDSWVEFTLLGGGLAISDATQYAILLRCSYLDSWPQVPAWWIDASSPGYTGGASLLSTNGGSTWPDTGYYGWQFECWGL